MNQKNKPLIRLSYASKAKATFLCIHADEKSVRFCGWWSCEFRKVQLWDIL